MTPLTSNVVAVLLAVAIFALSRADHSVRAISLLDECMSGFVAGMSFVAHLAFAILSVVAVIIVCSTPIRHPLAPIPAHLRRKKVFFMKNTFPPMDAAPSYPANPTTMPSVETLEPLVSSIVDDSMDWQSTVTVVLPPLEIPAFLGSPLVSPLKSSAALAAPGRCLKLSAVRFTCGPFVISPWRESENAVKRRAAIYALNRNVLPPPREEHEYRQSCRPDIYVLEASKHRPGPLKSSFMVAYFGTQSQKKVHW